MSDNQLFRPEAIAFKKNLNYGMVAINTPHPFKWVTVAALVLVVILIIYGYQIDFNQEYSVHGYITSDKGIVQVYSQKPGIITGLLVKQETQVKAGEALYTIDTSLASDQNKLQLREELSKRKIAIEGSIKDKIIHISKLKSLFAKNFISAAELDEQLEALASLKANKSVIDMEIIRYEQAQGYTITAPVDGLVANINYQVGQFTNLNKPLLKILPKAAELEAELYVPVRQAGFLNIGDSIILHYDPYPFQRFGNFKAVITQVSQTILIDEEEDKPFKIGEPYYKVKAKLITKYIRLHGKEKAIQPGLTFTAVISGNKKTIKEWLFNSV